eukprot:17659_1
MLSLNPIKEEEPMFHRSGGGYWNELDLSSSANSVSSESVSSLDGVHQWTIQGQLLDEILSAKVGQGFKSEPFRMSNIENSEWQIEIFPNGWDTDVKYTGYCHVYLSLLSMPSSWNELMICRTIRCVQTESSLTKLARYKELQSRGWVYALPFDEIKRGNFSKLDFIITMNTQQIAFKPRNEIHCPFDAPYEKERQLIYKVDEVIMRRLSHCRAGKRIESEIFDNMWCIGLCPNGDIPENAGKCVISLSLCGFPSDVSKMKVRWTISIKELHQKKCIKSEFSLKRPIQNCIATTFDRFQRMKKGMNVCINVEILHQYDEHGDEIECDGLSDTDDQVQLMELQHRVERMNEKIELLNSSASESLQLHQEKEVQIQLIQAQVSELLEEQKETEAMKQHMNIIDQQVTQMNDTLARIEFNHSNTFGSRFQKGALRMLNGML